MKHGSCIILLWSNLNWNRCMYVHIIICPTNITYLCAAGSILKTLRPNRPLTSNIFFRPKTFSKEGKTKSATIASFSSLPFFLLALSFSFFVFLRYCYFRTYRAQKTCLLALSHSFQNIGCIYSNLREWSRWSESSYSCVLIGLVPMLMDNTDPFNLTVKGFNPGVIS